jgi:hypothetical protein
MMVGDPGKHHHGMMVGNPGKHHLPIIPLMMFLCTGMAFWASSGG